MKKIISFYKERFKAAPIKTIVKSALVLLLLYFVVPFLITLGFATYNTITNKYPEGPIYRKVTAGVEYCVPTKYLRHGDDPNTEGFLITAMYPEMGPMTERFEDLKARDEFYKKILILFDPISYYKPFNEYFEIAVNNYRVKKTNQVKYGLEFWAHDPAQKDLGWGDMFVDRVNGKITSYKVCHRDTGPSQSSYPQCSQKTQKDKIKFSISYSKRLLPEWKDVQEKSLALIKSFECNNQSSSSNGKEK